MSRLHHLDEQIVELRQVALAKVRNRSVGGKVVRAQDPIRHVFMQLRCDLARREGPRGIGVYQHLQHHPRVEGLVARPSITVAIVEPTKVQCIDRVGKKKRQVFFRQPIAKRGREQERLIGLAGAVFSRHTAI